MVEHAHRRPGVQADQEIERVGFLFGNLHFFEQPGSADLFPLPVQQVDFHRVHNQLVAVWVLYADRYFELGFIGIDRQYLYIVDHFHHGFFEQELTGRGAKHHQRQAGQNKELSHIHLKNFDNSYVQQRNHCSRAQMLKIISACWSSPFR